MANIFDTDQIKMIGRKFALITQEHSNPLVLNGSFNDIVKCYKRSIFCFNNRSNTVTQFSKLG